MSIKNNITTVILDTYYGLKSKPKMKSENPFKVGNIVSFKEEKKDDFISEEDRFTVTKVIGHCVYIEQIFEDEDFNCGLLPIPAQIGDDPWHYKAFNLVK